MEYCCGDEIDVVIDRDGLGLDEGVAHLPDETMVLVSGAAGKAGEAVHALIIGVERTPLGAGLRANVLA